MCTVLNYIFSSCLWSNTWFFNKHSSDHACFCFSPYVMEDSCYFSCFLEIILVFVDVFLCLLWHSVLTLFFVLSNCFFGSISVLWILSVFDSLEMIFCWFPCFIFVSKINSILSHCLFWLFVFGYAFRTAYHLELIFWTTSAYTALFLCIILTWVLFVNISQCLFMFLNLFSF